MNSSFVPNGGVSIDDFVWHPGKPVQRIRRVREMDCGLGKQLGVEGTRHAGGEVPAGGREGGEERVEIVVREVVEEDLKF